MFLEWLTSRERTGAGETGALLLGLLEDELTLPEGVRGDLKVIRIDIIFFFSMKNTLFDL